LPPEVTSCWPKYTSAALNAPCVYDTIALCTLLRATVPGTLPNPHMPPNDTPPKVGLTYFTALFTCTPQTRLSSAPPADAFAGKPHAQAGRRIRADREGRHQIADEIELAAERHGSPVPAEPDVRLRTERGARHGERAVGGLELAFEPEDRKARAAEILPARQPPHVVARHAGLQRELARRAAPTPHCSYR
jgi:hypothetical protein